MIWTILVLAATFVAGMVVLDLFLKISGVKIVLPDDSFIMRFWHDRRDENPRTMCEIFFLLTTTTVGNILGGLLVLGILVGMVLAPIALVKGAIEFGLEQSSDPKVVAGIVVLAIALMVAALAAWLATLIGGIKATEAAEKKFRISRFIFPIFRAIAWPFRMVAMIYRIARDKACPMVTIAESEAAQAQ